MMYAAAAMSSKVEPGSEFGKRLYRLRREKGYTQIQLAEAIESTQRAISHYETVAEFPPPAVIIDLAKALQVSADELLGLEKPKDPRRRTESIGSPDVQRLWKKFRQVLSLPEKDQRAIIRMINSLVAVKR